MVLKERFRKERTSQKGYTHTPTYTFIYSMQNANTQSGKEKHTFPQTEGVTKAWYKERKS